MREQGAELFLVVGAGRFFFVCVMHTEWQKMLITRCMMLLLEHGKFSEQQAIDYVNQLKKEKRYVRDVY